MSFDDDGSGLFFDDVPERNKEWTDSPDEFVRSLLVLRSEEDVDEAKWRVRLCSSGMMDFSLREKCSGGRPLLMSWLDATLEKCSVRGGQFGEFDASVLESMLLSGADPYDEDEAGTNSFGLWKTSGVYGSPRSYMDWRKTLPIFANHVDLITNRNKSGRNGSAIESLIRFAWPQAIVLDDLEKVVGRDSLVKFRSKRGMTLLFIACYELDVSGVEWTLKKLGTDPNEQSLDGLTPFHAVALGLSRYPFDAHTKIADALAVSRWLLSSGGDASITDSLGKYPSEYAKDESLKRLLEKESLSRKGFHVNGGTKRRSL